MNTLYLKKCSITSTAFVCLSLSLTGCTSLPKSYDEPNSKRLSDNVILPSQLGIEYLRWFGIPWFPCGTSLRRGTIDE